MILPWFSSFFQNPAVICRFFTVILIHPYLWRLLWRRRNSTLRYHPCDPRKVAYHWCWVANSFLCVSLRHIQLGYFYQCCAIPEIEATIKLLCLVSRCSIIPRYLPEIRSRAILVSLGIHQSQSCHWIVRIMSVCTVTKPVCIAQNTRITANKRMCSIDNRHNVTCGK